MSRVIEEFTSDVRHLASIRALVRQVCRGSLGYRLGDEALAHLELAVHEAAANIMRHGYGGNTGESIELVIDTEPDRVRVYLYHYGVEFDRSSVPPPVLDASRTGGYGLFLIERSVDQVEYFRDARGRSCVLLVKRCT